MSGVVMPSLRGTAIRLLSSGDDGGDDDDDWTPMDENDYVHLGITIGYQCLVLIVVIHLWICRKWPPYVPRQISLLCITGIAGIVAYVGALIAYGVMERHEGDFIANCSVEALFDYTGWGVWTSVALVRVYRSWKILIKHSVAMWPAWAQVALLSLPWCIPVVAFSIKPSLAPFHEGGNWCDINEPIDTALYVYGALPIVGAFVLSFQMRKVRKQMNEFKLQVYQLAFLLLIGTVLFPLVESWLETRDDIRRTWIMWDNVVSSIILFWLPIAEPFFRYLIGDEQYLYSYTAGFSTLPTPSQMRSSLKDQLSVEQLRQAFEKYTDQRVARELPDFYLACLDREEIDDFFERQAATTMIIDSFIRIGAPQEVNISAKHRQAILDTELTRYNIFHEAMDDVLMTMDNNFSADFQETEGFKNLENQAQREAEELDRLRKMNQLPPTTHVEQESNGVLKLIRLVSDSVGVRSSEKGTSSRRTNSEKTHSSSGQPHSIGIRDDSWMDAQEFKHDDVDVTEEPIESLEMRDITPSIEQPDHSGDRSSFIPEVGGGYDDDIINHTPPVHKNHADVIEDRDGTVTAKGANKNSKNKPTKTKRKKAAVVRAGSQTPSVAETLRTSSVRVHGPAGFDSAMEATSVLNPASCQDRDSLGRCRVDSNNATASWAVHAPFHVSAVAVGADNEAGGKQPAAVTSTQHNFLDTEAAAGPSRANVDSDVERLVCLDEASNQHARPSSAPGIRSTVESFGDTPHGSASTCG